MLQASTHDNSLNRTQVRFDIVHRRGTPMQMTIEELDTTNAELKRTNEDLQVTAGQLERTSAYLQTLMSSMVDSLVVTDIEGQITDVNRATERISGYERAELIGERFERFFAESEQARAGMERVLSGSNISNYELTLLTRDGRRVPVSYNATVLIGPDGNRMGVLGSARDISELKHAEEALQRAHDELEQRVRDRTAALAQANEALHAEVAGRRRIEETLRESEQHYRELYEGAPNAYLSTDAEGRILKANRQAVRLLDYPLDELLGRQVLDLYVDGATGKGRASELFEQFRRGREVRGQELEMRRAGSTRVWVGLSVQPIRDAHGRVTETRLAVVDITERKLAEQTLAAHAQELARSNAELEQFAYIASHDLQEPLRVISSYVQLLARRYQGKLGEDAERWVDYVVSGARRMKGLIDDLLLYSRAGRPEHAVENVDCHEALLAAIASLERAIEETGAGVSIGPLPVIAGDTVQISQLFQNLLENAIKYRCDQAPRITIESQRSGEEWVVSVADNGMGIAPEHTERVFQIFQRLHEPGKFPGSGIGLAVAKKIVERHHGRIWFESQPGEGTTFYFTFPALAQGDGHGIDQGKGRWRKRNSRF